MIQNVGPKNTKSAKYPTTTFIDQQMANGQGGSSNICTCQPTREIILDTSLSRQELPGVIADRGK